MIPAPVRLTHASPILAGLIRASVFGASLFPHVVLAQSADASAPSVNADVVVKVDRISIEGSRFELSSVEMLTGLRPGQKINETSLRKAIQRMLDSGLTKNIEYYYESLSDPASVALSLKITDESPLLPASIQIPDVEAEDVWGYLKSIDPLFTRELPRTQKALAFYGRYIERYLASIRRSGHVATVITADPGGNANGIVFVPANLLGTPQFRGNRGTGSANPASQSKSGSAKDETPASPEASRPSSGDPPANR